MLGEYMREIKGKNPEKPLARHFTRFHEGDLAGMKVKGIYHLIQILQKEKMWIYRLGSLMPMGLNNCIMYIIC